LLVFFIPGGGEVEEEVEAMTAGQGRKGD